MPLINYKDIYKRALVRINDLDLANLMRDDFYDFLKEWLHSTASSPLFRNSFSTFELDDNIMTVNFILKRAVDDNYDINFVTDILAKGVIINYFPSRIDTSMEMAAVIGGKEEKKLTDHYSKKMERLHTLRTEWHRELTQHGYYFGSVGDT